MIFEKAAALKLEGISFCTVTLVSVKGSAPQDPGAKCIVTEKGLYEGTIGGGKVEARAIDYCLEMLKDTEASKPKLKSWNLQTDIGMTCGGEVTFLFEHYPASSWPIAIFGAGHVANALTNILATLNCQVTCIDPRAEWITKLPKSAKNLKVICHEEPKDLVSKFNKNTFFLSITQGHAHDTPILAEIGRQFPETPYVGVIGSASKGNRIRKELQELDLPRSFIEKLRIPIGLPIGNNDPSEIAISIVAELIQVRDQ